MRKGLIALAVVAVLAAVAAIVLTSGEEPLITLSPPEHKLRIEAAGTQYAGWPIMGVLVNGEEIAEVTIDSISRKMWDVDVPGSVGEVSTIMLTLKNYQECQNVGTGACETRKLIVRGMYLDDKKLENPVASGDRNLSAVIQTDEGGITWEVPKS